MIKVYDVSYFQTLDKEGTVLHAASGVCFALFNYKERHAPFKLEEAEHLNVWFSVNTTRKTSSVFLDELYKSGLLDKDVVTITFHEKLPDCLIPHMAEKHEKYKRFVCISYKLGTWNFQKIYHSYSLLRALQNEPMMLWYFRKTMDFSMDVLKRVALCTYIVGSCAEKFAKKLSAHPDDSAYHTYTYQHTTEVKHTVKTLYEYLDNEYKGNTRADNGYNCSYQSLIFARHPEINGIGRYVEKPVQVANKEGIKILVGLLGEKV